MVYKDEMPNYINKDAKINREYEIINKLPKDFIIYPQFIYPLEELRAASENDFVFFKSEHHWSEYGAYVGYKALEKEIQKDFPQVKEVDLKDYKIFKSKDVRADFKRRFTFGTTNTSLGISKNYLRRFQDVEYTYYNFDNQGLSMVADAKQLSKTFHYEKGNDLKLLLIGTSMDENLLQFLPLLAKDTLSLRINNNGEGSNLYRLMHRFSGEILDYKPDIMVFCICAQNMNRMKYLFDDYKEE